MGIYEDWQIQFKTSFRPIKLQESRSSPHAHRTPYNNANYHDCESYLSSLYIKNLVFNRITSHVSMVISLSLRKTCKWHCNLNLIACNRNQIEPHSFYPWAYFCFIYLPDRTLTCSPNYHDCESYLLSLYIKSYVSNRITSHVSLVISLSLRKIVSGTAACIWLRVTVTK